MNGLCQAFVLLVCVSVGHGASQFLRGKQKCHFCLADKSGDGKLTKEDYALIAGSSRPRCDRNQDEVDKIVDAAWKAFPNRDMTLTEYLDASDYLAINDKPTLLKAIKDLSSVMYKLWNCDLDNSGKQMSAGDFANGEFSDLNLVGNRATQGADAVGGLDTAGNDQLVSEDEYNEGAEGYFTSEDKLDGSRFFFGGCYDLDFESNQFACHP